MPMLKNYQHEKFAQAIFSGMNQTNAAIEAGYKKTRARQTGAQLVTYSVIKERIKELNEATEDFTIASVKERKQVLTEIIRGRFTHFMDTNGNLVELTEANLKSAALQEVRITQFTGGKDGRAKERSTTIKLHSSISAVDLLNKMGGDYPAAKVEIEPGKNLGEAIEALLSKVKGREKRE